MLGQKWRNEAFLDVINLALGTFLFLSPWIFEFTSGLARHTSWIAGATIATVAICAIADLFESEEWINLIVGLWVAVCGWIVGFSADAPAMQVHLIVGSAVAAIAATELLLLHRTPPRVRM